MPTISVIKERHHNFFNKDLVNKRGKENHNKISKTHTDREVLLNNDGYSMKNIPLVTFRTYPNL